MSTVVQRVHTLQTGNPVITNALSVDVEEYYHAVIFQEGTRGFLRSGLESRVEQSVDRILDLMSVPSQWSRALTRWWAISLAPS